jgi:hypothetical protein
MTTSDGAPSEDQKSELTPYQWKLPTEVNPAEGDASFCNLLTYDVFIDKSAILYYLLKDYFVSLNGDFRPVTLYLVYPRRFAKTTLLGFIEALFSPVATLDHDSLDTVREKIASLECGKQLLAFGLHPVIWLDMLGVTDVEELNYHIGRRLKRAGMDKQAIKEFITSIETPNKRLLVGAKWLNEKFEKDYGLPTRTIVMVDEHDKPFRRKRGEKNNDALILELTELYGLGKDMADSGISLLILCGLTRIAGSGLSEKNNLVDVSRKSKYHGLCGISAKEFVKSCSRDLDELAKKTYDDQTLEMVLQKEFGKDWDGFRFGIDDEVGVVNPNLPEGVMFSPLDVWHVVYSLVRGKKPRSSRWMATMDYEFEFTSFAEMYSSREGFIELAQNLEGGWVATGLLESKLEREDYMLLSSDLHTKKVFLELGLLSVKSVRADEVLLGSPNWMVTLHTMILLVEKQRHKATPLDLAKVYLNDSENGFGRIVAKAASAATNIFRGTGEDAFREYPFQYFLFMQLFYRFPIVDFTSNRRPTDYKLYKQVCLV